MQELSEEYDKRYSAAKDKFKCDDVVEIHSMAKKASEDLQGSFLYFLVTYSLQAGFMRGYRSACYDIKKQKGGYHGKAK